MEPKELAPFAVAQAEQAGDAADRAVVAHQWHTASERCIRDLARVRRQAVRDMVRQGFTYAEIGKLLDVTRQRAYQLAKGGR